jgi:hypothetical protein
MSGALAHDREGRWLPVFLSCAAAPRPPKDVSMRPGQNKRIRGRNRKGPNPLSRSYESNGPDVKVRGTAAHVAEKYVQLARDAHSSGDPVSAESYLQHAEHYFRLLMAAQAQPQQPYPQNGNFQPRQEVENDDSEEFDDDFDGGVMDRFTFRAPQQAQQPNNGNGPYQGEDEGEGNDAQPRFEGSRQDQPRQDQPRQDRPRQDRPRQDRPRQDQQDQPRQDQPRQDQPRYEGQADQQRGERYDNRGPRPERAPRFRDRDNRDRERQPYSEQRAFEQRQQRPPMPVQSAPAPEPVPAGLPAFITGGRSAPAPEQPVEEPRIVEPKIVTPVFEGEAAEAPAPRPRRRRKVKEVEEVSSANDKSDVPAAE